MSVTSLKIELTGIELMNELANRARLCYDLSSLSKIKLLNYETNADYLVEDPKNGLRTVLHITDSHIGKDKLSFQVQWMQEILKSTKLIVPEPIMGVNGSFVQSLSLPFLVSPYHCVMFSFLQGSTITEDDQSRLNSRFAMLGETAALLHQNGIQWNSENHVTRPFTEYSNILDFNHQFAPFSGSVGKTYEQLFDRTLKLIKIRLKAFGTSFSRFGLIHGNLTVQSVSSFKNRVTVFNFDHCGYGWFLYDCGASLAPIMHLPEAEKLTALWIDGYRKNRNLAKDDRAEIPTFLMLHRFVLLERLLSLPSEFTDESKSPDFIDSTAALCESYLAKHL